MELSNPKSHPYPPIDFNQQLLPVSVVELEAYRLNPAHHNSALYFDRSGSGRFDSKDEMGILYLGTSIEAAFIETFGRQLGEKFVSREFVKSRILFKIKSDRPLELLNLYGSGLAKIGVDSELTSGRNYQLSRSWAKAIEEHPQQTDGIIYVSRHDNTLSCIGLFERDTYSLSEKKLGNLIEFDEMRFYQILDRYEFGSD